MNDMYLNISKATMYDAGVYTCVIENSLGKLNRSFQLIVQGRSLDRPVFTSKSTNLTQYEGDNVTFECLFYSDASPFVQWYVRRRSIKLERNHQENELEFIKVIEIFFISFLNSSYKYISKKKNKTTNSLSICSFLMGQDLV
jgi:hypothetical protein